MKKSIIIFVLIVSAFFPKYLFANAPKCPDFSKISLSADEVIGKIDECQSARAKGNPASITDFQCPAGDFGLEDNRPFNADQIAYYVTVNVFFNEADKKMKEFMEALNKVRDKDPVSWIDSYNSCILGKGNETQKSLSHFYSNICQFSMVSDFLATSSDKERKFFASSDAYPQTWCQNIANRKKQAWENFGETLMIKGIYKSYQNDRDHYMHALGKEYRSIISKFHTWQKIVFRASSKMTNFIREAVK